MRLYGVEWPEGWETPDRHVVSVLGPYVTRPISDGRAFRVRTPMLRELSDKAARADQWIAEYMTKRTTWEIAVCDDALVACGLCLLFDTTEADAELW